MPTLKEKRGLQAQSTAELRVAAKSHESKIMRRLAKTELKRRGEDR